MKSEKIGILGGTFDPIHFGHLKIAKFCQKKLSLDKILFIPSGRPPHKNPVEKYEHRVNMVKNALDNKNSFLLAQYEKPTKIKSEYNYTFETLNKVNQKYPDSELYFIIGEDNVTEIKNWYKYKELFDMANFIVLSRKRDTKTQIKNLPYYKKLIYIDMPKINISSDEIRKNLYKNKKIKKFVPLKVWNYIKKHKLYTN